MATAWLSLVLFAAVLLWPAASSFPGSFSIPPYDNRTARAIAELRRYNGSVGCDIMHGRNVRPHKVLLFVDSSFFPLFRNWMIYYQEACGTTSASLRRLEIVCMDGNVTQLLDTLSVNCSDTYSSIVYEHQSKRHRHQSSMVWMKRLEIINAILSTGTDLILSDSDALWVSNPYPDLNQFVEQSHIIASRGWFPFSLSKKWGSTLCMGFIYIKASAFTIQFFDQVLRNMMQKQLEMEAYHHYLQTNETVYVSPERNQTFLFDLSWWASVENKEPDDQYSANRLLYDMQIEWPPLMNLTYRTSAHHGIVAFKRNEYRITLLPENLYLRNCANNDLKRVGRMRYPSRSAYLVIQQRISTSAVAHCLLAPGESRRKENYLVYYSLWRLPYNASAVMDFITKDLRIRRANRNVTALLTARRGRFSHANGNQSLFAAFGNPIYSNRTRSVQRLPFHGLTPNETNKIQPLPLSRRRPNPARLPLLLPGSSSSLTEDEELFLTLASQEADRLEQRRQKLLDKIKSMRSKHMRARRESYAHRTASDRGTGEPPVSWLQTTSQSRAAAHNSIEREINVPSSNSIGREQEPPPPPPPPPPQSTEQTAAPAEEEGHSPEVKPEGWWRPKWDSSRLRREIAKAMRRGNQLSMRRVEPENESV